MTSEAVELDARSPARASSHWAVKPTLIGVLSAVLLCIILATIGAAALLFRSSFAVPLLPLLAFIIVRATLAAVAPAPKNFDTVSGQLQFLVSQSQSLAGLCFSYSVMKLATEVLPRNSSAAGASSPSVLFVAAVLALLLLIWGLAQLKILTRRAEAGTGGSTKDNIVSLSVYLCSCGLSSVYVVALVPLSGGLSILSWVTQFYPMFPAVGTIVIAVFAFVVLGNVTTKSVENIRHFLLDRKKLHEAAPVTEKSDFHNWQHLPVLPSLAYEVCLRFAGRSMLQVGVWMVVFLVGIGIAATVLAAGILAIEAAPVAERHVTAGVRWFGDNPIVLVAIATGVLLALFLAALSTQLPTIYRESKSKLEIARLELIVRQIRRSQQELEAQQRKLAGLAERYSENAEVVRENSATISETLRIAELNLEEARKRAKFS